MSEIVYRSFKISREANRCLLQDITFPFVGFLYYRVPCYRRPQEVLPEYRRRAVSVWAFLIAAILACESSSREWHSKIVWGVWAFFLRRTELIDETAVPSGSQLLIRTDRICFSLCLPFISIYACLPHVLPTVVRQKKLYMVWTMY